MLLRRRGRSECARRGYAWPRSGQLVARTRSGSRRLLPRHPGPEADAREGASRQKAGQPPRVYVGSLSARGAGVIGYGTVVLVRESRGDPRRMVRPSTAFDATLVQARHRVAWLLAEATTAGAKS